MFEQKIVMDRVAIKTHEAFGLTELRVVEILKKLIAVTEIYPRWSTIAEVFLNCEDRFTEMERLFGLFLLGETKGQATILKQKNIQLKFERSTMPLQIKLLSLLSKQVTVEDKMLNQLFESGGKKIN